jgi:hypothetical protein
VVAGDGRAPADVAGGVDADGGDGGSGGDGAEQAAAATTVSVPESRGSKSLTRVETQ